MASSNRHWPSMFKSKPCNQHPWQHDINPNSPLVSSACHRTPYSSGSEERTPEPKPRWNPKPEQIRILEAIFNSGMVNPPRDEIRKIRIQLQEYGQVGDANVFYWFQNRKSRTKHKQQRHLQTNKHRHPQQPITTSATSSSSSSEKPSLSPPKASSVVDVANSPTASVNQTYFSGGPAAAEFPLDGFFFPAGFGFPEDDQAAVGGGAGVLLSELMMVSGQCGHAQKKVEEEKLLKLQQQQMISTFGVAAPTVPSAITQILGTGVGESCPVGPQKSTVFINDVAFEVGVGPFNVREAFGDDAVLVHCSGQPVVTNEWGVTLHSLQPGAFYYLLRTLTPITTAPQTPQLI
ncbi:WUSCHEL-related homeobox 9-like [Actinidia eriantha]|uniref:WUSCHEL-related homeobox 9-like n=1 Tax=Actinidia eriantha TaxID=165200 RepID=UPI0025864AC8|nr:WUSCHEL-related homeobox 9-like [Actinidia eriantha]